MAYNKYRGRRGGYWGYNRSPPKRLSDIKNNNNDYIAPVRTRADLLTKEQIEEKLKHYERVDDDKVQFIRTGTFVRYFITDKEGKKKFRNGGIVYRKFPEYFVLVSNNVSWTVSLKGTSFWRKMKPEEIIEDCEEEVEQKDNEIERMKKEIRKLKKKRQKNSHNTY